MAEPICRSGRGIIENESCMPMVEPHVSVSVGMDRYFGSLTVDADAIRCAPEGVGNKLSAEAPRSLTHEGREVVLVVGRLLTPWMNSVLVLVDPSLPNRWTGVVLLSAWQRRRLADAMRSCGYRVLVVRTATSAGGGVGSVPELERLLASRTWLPLGALGSGNLGG